MVRTTHKLPSPLLKAFNCATGEFSTHSTGFNETTWGDQTWGFIKLINKQLRLERYDKIVVGVWDIAKKSCSVVCTEEVIDLMGNEPPDEYTMLIDIPSDLKIGRFPWSRTIMQNIKWVLTSSAILSRQQTLDGMSHMETGMDTGTWTILVFLGMRMMGKTLIIF